jgi:transcriptional regulator with XRE-family HTH domain
MPKHRTEHQVEVSDLIGVRVKTVRDGRGWSRKRLAEECVSRGYPWLNYMTLTHIERNARPEGLRRNLTVDELSAIAAALEVDATQFMRPLMEEPFERHHFFEAGYRLRMRDKREASSILTCANPDE